MKRFITSLILLAFMATGAVAASLGSVTTVSGKGWTSTYAPDINDDLTNLYAAPLVMQSNQAVFSAERALAAGSMLSLTDGGANSSITYAVNDAELLCLGGLTSAADKIPYFTGSGTCALADFSSAFRTFLTTPSSANLGSLVTDDAFLLSDAELGALAGLTSAADKIPYFTGSGTAALGDFPSAFRTFLTTPSTANLAAVLSDEATGWATFQVTPSMANLGSLLTNDAAGWTTFGTTPTSANLGALLTDELDSATKVLVFLGAPADDQVPVGDSATGTTWRTLPSCSAATDKLNYNISTNSWSCGTDDDIPDAADYTNLSATSPITQSGGTISTSISTNRLVGRATASSGVMEQLTPDATLSITAGAVGVVDVTCTGCLGTTEIAALDAANDITTGSLADARMTLKTESFCVAASDETTAITTGTSKTTFRMPYAFTLTGIRGSLNTVSSSGSPIIDVNEAGTTIMTTNKILIDVSEKTSVTAVTPPTLTDTSLADDAEMSVDVDTAGTGAKGLKICLIGHQ